MSDHELPETHPIHHLEKLVRHLGEELAAFRKRAIQAESRLKSFEGSTRSGDLFAEQKVVLLEKENAELRARLAFATERARGVLEQVRFLRQQSSRPVTGAGNGADA